MEEVKKFPNGLHLYREPNEAGGHRYWTDIFEEGLLIWDTSVVDRLHLLSAIVAEDERIEAKRVAEYMRKRANNSGK